MSELTHFEIVESLFEFFLCIHDKRPWAAMGSLMGSPLKTRTTAFGCLDFKVFAFIGHENHMVRRGIIITINDNTTFDQK